MSFDRNRYYNKKLKIKEKPLYIGENKDFGCYVLGGLWSYLATEYMKRKSLSGEPGFLP